MAQPRISHNRVRLCLASLLALAVLVWSSSGFNGPALEPQLDEPGSVQLVPVDVSGDSPAGDSNLSGVAPLEVPPLTGSAVYSPSLSFVEPPARRVSYPALPQGPPLLV